MQFAEGEVAQPTSPQYDKVRSCTSKVAYASKELADKALVVANRNDDGPYTIYICRWCKMRHIGHVETFKNRHQQSKTS